jgi:hypothetical protein
LLGERASDARTGCRHEATIGCLQKWSRKCP